MGQKLFYTMVVIEGEIHISGDLCWCGSHYDENSGMFLHKLQVDRGKTHDTSEYLQ